MPTKPPHLCYKAGCYKPTHGRFCEEHRKEGRIFQKRYNAQRAETDRQYNLTCWQALRAKKKRHNPFCEHCLKEKPMRLTAAELIDHIIPVKQGGGMLDWDNLQSLCRDCHRIKTLEDAKKYGYSR